MCGIFGYIGKIPAEHQKAAFAFLTQLAIETQRRGNHAAGFAALDKNGAISGLKYAGPMTDLIKYESMFKELAKELPDIFIGHTRWATTGPASIPKNNHPFYQDDWTIVHNGHISGWYGLAQKHKFKMESDTDSEVIVHLLASEKNHIQGVKKVFHECDTTDWGGFSVAAIQESQKRLHLFRNDAYPMVIFHVPAWNTLWFASVQEIVFDAMEKKGFTEDFQIKDLSSYLLLTIDLDLTNRQARIADKPVKKAALPTKVCSSVVTAKTQMVKAAESRLKQWTEAEWREFYEWMYNKQNYEKDKNPIEKK